MKYSEINEEELIGRLIFDVDSDTYHYFLTLEKNVWYEDANYKGKGISIYFRNEEEFDISYEKTYYMLEGEFEFVEEYPLKDRINKILKLIL